MELSRDIYDYVSHCWHMSQTLTSNLTVSGGFAIVQPDSVLSINAVEGFPLEEFSAEVSTYPDSL